MRQLIVCFYILMCLNALRGAFADSISLGDECITSSHFVESEVRNLKPKVTSSGVDSSWTVVPNPTDGWLIFKEGIDTNVDDPDFALISDTVCLNKSKQPCGMTRKCIEKMSSPQNADQTDRNQKFYIVLRFGVRYFMTKEEFDRHPEYSLFATLSFVSVTLARRYLQNIIGRK